MCERAKLRDPALGRLCEGIVSSQRREIDFMKRKLRDPASSERSDAPSAR
jgi:hypothetical protein